MVPNVSKRIKFFLYNPVSATGSHQSFGSYLLTTGRQISQVNPAKISLNILLSTLGVSIDGYTRVCANYRAVKN
jgi:hypothetical protein